MANFDIRYRIFDFINSGILNKDKVLQDLIKAIPDYELKDIAKRYDWTLTRKQLRKNKFEE